jgi:cytochrome c oxidase subunit 2
VKELGIKTEVKKDSTSEVTFTPQKEGTYTGTCAHFCGRGHGSMKLTIHVTG